MENVSYRNLQRSQAVPNSHERILKKFGETGRSKSVDAALNSHCYQVELFPNEELLLGRVKLGGHLRDQVIVIGVGNSSEITTLSNGKRLISREASFLVL